jgi:hypothetical protein
VFSPGKTEASWTTKISPVTNPIAQLRQLDRDAHDSNAVVYAICSANDSDDDAVCTFAKANRASCHAVGTDFLSCPLDRQARKSLLGYP